MNTPLKASFASVTAASLRRSVASVTATALIASAALASATPLVSEVTIRPGLFLTPFVRPALAAPTLANQPNGSISLSGFATPLLASLALSDVPTLQLQPFTAPALAAPVLTNQATGTLIIGALPAPAVAAPGLASQPNDALTPSALAAPTLAAPALASQVDGTLALGPLTSPALAAPSLASQASGVIVLGALVAPPLVAPGVDPVGSSAWEDFEDSDSRLSSGDTGSLAIAAGSARTGSLGLARTAASNSHAFVWDGGTICDASATFTYSGWVRMDTAAGTTCLAGLALVQTGSATNYSFILDRRNGSGGGNASFQMRLNNGGSPLATAGSLGLAINTWYRIEVEWRTSGTRLTARLYASDGTTLLATLTSTDATYATGLRPGLHTFQLCSFDDLTLTT